MFSFVYNIFLGIGFIFYLPKIFYKTFKQKGYRYPFLQRLGLKVPQFQKKEGAVVWIHAISLGETKAAICFIETLNKKLNNPTIYLSSGTETGHAEAKKSSLVHNAFFMPLDFSWAMKRLYKQIKPDMICLIETDFWYHFLKIGKELGVKIFVISGKISQKSTDVFSFFFPFSKKLFSKVDLFCLQNSVYQERFLKIGIDRSKLHLTGNLKFDQKAKFSSENDLKKYKDHFGIQEGDQVITLASTHDPEEKLLIEALKSLGAKILVVPRHPHRFEDVYTMLCQQGYSVGRYTKLDQIKKENQFILIDTMGFLPVCYQLSDIVIVAGSYTPHVGGHNILEPVLYKKYVLFGPYMYSQEELKEIALRENMGEQVNLEHILECVKGHLLEKTNLEKRTISFSGSSEKAWNLVKPMLKNVLLVDK